MARCLLLAAPMDHALVETCAASDLGALLARDHAQLDARFRDLLAAFETDARDDVARLWNEFDSELRAHLLFEEEHLLPTFLDFNAPEALALLREHQSIRDKLLALGVGVDLHATRQEQVAAFVCALRAHAKREDALLYAWAATHVGPAERQAFVHGRPGR